MTTTVTRLQNDPVPVEQPEGDESEESDVGHANVGKISQPRDKVPDGSSTAHTDSENNAIAGNDHHPRNVSKYVKAVASTSPKTNDSKPVNETRTEEMECQNKDKLEQAVPDNNNPVVAGRPHSAKRARAFSRKKKANVGVDLSSSDEDGTDHQRSNGEVEESYAQMKMRRKTLLKIERISDSDSRSRDQMRSRGLSPPSSSDEENLYIGWVAYPTSPSKTRINKTNGQNRQRALCTCINALKYLASPVMKVCKLCRNNKVQDVDSLKESLFNDSPDSDAISESKKTK